MFFMDSIVERLQVLNGGSLSDGSGRDRRGVVHRGWAFLEESGDIKRTADEDRSREGLDRDGQLRGC